MAACRKPRCQFRLRRAVTGVGGFENLQCQIVACMAGAVDVAAGTFAQFFTQLQVLIRNGL